MSDNAPGGASPTAARGVLSTRRSEEASGGRDAPGGASPTAARGVLSTRRSEEASGGRIAIVHEKFTIYAGSEKVVEQMHLLWPDAPIYCSVCDPATLGGALAGADVRTSPLQRLYHGGDNYAHLLPLLPWAASHHDLSGYDLVITSHHQFANRVRPDAAATVVSYVHSPACWMWDPAMRAEETGGMLGRSGLALFARTQQRADRHAARASRPFAREQPRGRQAHRELVGSLGRRDRTAGRRRLLPLRRHGGASRTSSCSRAGSCRTSGPRSRSRLRRVHASRSWSRATAGRAVRARRSRGRAPSSSAPSTTRRCATSTVAAERCSIRGARTSASCPSKRNPAARR